MGWIGQISIRHFINGHMNQIGFLIDFTFMAVAPNWTVFLIFRALVWHNVCSEAMTWSWIYVWRMEWLRRLSRLGDLDSRFVSEVQEAVFYHSLEPAIFGQSNMYCYSKGERNLCSWSQFPQLLIGLLSFINALTPTWVKMVLWWITCGVFFSFLFYLVTENIYSWTPPACTPCPLAALGVSHHACYEIAVVRKEALITP